MSDVFGQPAGSSVIEPPDAGVSWAAILAGAAASTIHAAPAERAPIGNPLVPQLNRLKAAFEQ